MTSCFVAGIVKGIVEHNSAVRHFGSTAGFSGHLADAVRAGVVDVHLEVTELGKRFYELSNLSKLEDTRDPISGTGETGQKKSREPGLRHEALQKRHVSVPEEDKEPLPRPMLSSCLRLWNDT